MEISVERQPSKAGATIGQMRIDGVHLCWTLEDQVREVPGEPVETWKVANETAIPRGRYQVTITPSVRFKRPMPLLVDVPGFAGIRIHPGNTAANTAGCILVGLTTQGNLIFHSREAFAQFFGQLEKALLNGEQVFIGIA